MYIFTDGSCIGPQNNRRAGWAVVLFDNDKNHFKSLYGKVEDIVTNQRAELTAMYIGFTQATPFSIIYSDSMYSINCVTKWAEQWKLNNWKTKNNSDVKHKDIIEKMVSLYEEKQIDLQYIKSHQKGDGFIIEGNRIADELAKKSCEN
tara:strand:- start:613 stop:1056 length:444 start_codon:yes stop_codon:yes gene_type:complete